MSDYSSEDDDLANAIALSLAGLDNSTPQEPIDLTGDDEDGSGESKQQLDSPSPKNDHHDQMASELKSAVNPAGNKSSSTNIEGSRFGIPGVNRKKMEEERLARMRKRKAISPPPSDRMAKTSKPSNAAGNIMSFTQQQAAIQATGVQYPKGIVKKTWAYGYPRQDDIKIEEVFQKNDLELAVLSAFQWDDEWLATKLNMAKTKLICVVQSHDEEHRDLMRTHSPANIRYVFPSMEGQINCMHSKLQLLSHPTHLRICVPSANLVPYDWGESGGTMENIVFLIDLPRLPEGTTVSYTELTTFGKELLYFLKALGMDQTTMNSILKFDFTQTKDLAFVHSIGGAHAGDTWNRTGFCSLAAAIRDMGFSTGDLELDYVSASIGSLNDGFLTALFLAAQGDDGMTAYNWRNQKPRGRRQGRSDEEQEIIDKVHHSFRVYFPTKKTVTESKGGAGGAGTICLQSNWWDAPTFPRSIFRNCQSMREGMLMHSKIIFARPCRNSTLGNASRFVAWAYLGSSNLSSSAWGSLVKDRETKLPKMNCKNWECGVVVPIITAPQTVSGVKSPKAEDVRGISVFDGIVPVPMQVPGEEYGSSRPWFFKEK